MVDVGACWSVEFALKVILGADVLCAGRVSRVGWLGGGTAMVDGACSAAFHRLWLGGVDPDLEGVAGGFSIAG